MGVIELCISTFYHSTVVVLNGTSIYPGAVWCTVSQPVQSNIARNHVVDRTKGNTNIKELSTLTTRFNMNYNNVMTCIDSSEVVEYKPI